MSLRFGYLIYFGYSLFVGGLKMLIEQITARQISQPDHSRLLLMVQDVTYIYTQYRIELKRI